MKPRTPKPIETAPNDGRWIGIVLSPYNVGRNLSTPITRWAYYTPTGWSDGSDIEWNHLNENVIGWVENPDEYDDYPHVLLNFAIERYYIRKLIQEKLVIQAGIIDYLMSHDLELQSEVISVRMDRLASELENHNEHG